MTRQNTPKGGNTRHSRGESLEQADSLRHDAIRKDVANRLRKACSHLSEEDFAALVQQIVNVQLKSEGRSR
jgi:hypothetical protein